MPKIVSITSAILLTMAPYVCCLADSEGEFVEIKNGVRYEYRQRRKDLKAQIDTRVTKGWINADQASTLNAERDRLVVATKKARAGGPKDQVNQMEKDVTAFNAKVSSTLSKSSAKPSTAGNANK